MKKLSWLQFSFLLSLTIFFAHPSFAQSGTEKSEEEPLPHRGIVLDIDSPERNLFKIAVPDLVGIKDLGTQAANVLRNDFKLVSLFRVLDPKSFVADYTQEGLGLKKEAWQIVGAQGVIKGIIERNMVEKTKSMKKDTLSVELRFYELTKSEAALIKKYQGAPFELRSWMHDFANQVIELLTGKKGVFGSQLAFARRNGPGKKNVYVADFDGNKVRRISKGDGVSMLPAFGPGGIWYSKLTPLGMFITNTQAKEKPVINGEGMSMGATYCGGRIYFSSTRDGNSEIYSATTQGEDVRRLTKHAAIDVSPSCGPGGKIAFVSGRHGSPQIFTMDSNGKNVKRVTYRGSYNQTPSWCRDPKQPLIAFTGMSEGTDVFTVNVETQEYTRITQGQGINKDPVFSSDCRMLAFWSSRGGIFISNQEGLNQTMVIRGKAETIRWSR